MVKEAHTEKIDPEFKELVEKARDEWELKHIERPSFRFMTKIIAIKIKSVGGIKV